MKQRIYDPITIKIRKYMYGVNPVISNQLTKTTININQSRSISSQEAQVGISQIPKLKKAYIVRT